MVLRIILKYIRLLIILIAGLIVTFPAQSFGNSRKNVLIIYEKTTFKNKLVLQLAKRLEKEGVMSKIVEHNSKGVTVDSVGLFDAIFITNSGVNSEVRPWILKWIDTNADYSSRIVLHTTQKSKWNVKTTVDAITSASAIKEIDKIVNDCYSLLKVKLESVPEDNN